MNNITYYGIKINGEPDDNMQSLHSVEYTCKFKK